jgi:hypothetical protein
MSVRSSVPIRRRLRLAAVVLATAAGSLALVPSPASASHAGIAEGGFCSNTYIGGGGTCIHSVRHRLQQTYGESAGIWVKVCAGAKETSTGGGNVISFSCSVPGSSNYVLSSWHPCCDKLGYAAVHNGSTSPHNGFYGYLWYYRDHSS